MKSLILTFFAIILCFSIIDNKRASKETELSTQDTDLVSVPQKADTTSFYSMNHYIGMPLVLPNDYISEDLD